MIKKKKNKYKPLFSVQLTVGKVIIASFAGVCLLVLFLLVFLQSLQINRLPDQNLKKRWTDENDYAQTSIFFPIDAELDQDSFIGFQKSIENVLKENSMIPENKGQRLIVDCYYEKGKIQLSREGFSQDVDALGVSPDFFLFHPFEYVSGGPVPAEEAMRDYIVIDERTAWSYFGATNVSGMTLMVGQVPHQISGVIRTPDDRVASAAGADKSIVYTSIDTLELLGNPSTYVGYEVLMPEPYEGFALATFKKVMEEYLDSAEVVENTYRFSPINLFKDLRNYKKRSMRLNAVVFPSWENVARYYETGFANLLIMEAILVLITVLVLIYFLSDLWKHRNYHKQDIKNGLIRIIENEREKRYRNKFEKQEKGDYT